MVSAIVTSHPQHAGGWQWLEQARTQEIQGVIATHTLAELYSVLTRLPYRPPISPAIAQRQISENLQGFARVELAAADYDAAIALMVALTLPGGGIFAALIAPLGRAIADVVHPLLNRHMNFGFVGGDKS